MTRIIKGITFIFILSITLTSCSKMIFRLYGMKNIKEVDDKTILRYAKRYQIPLKNIYQLDTAYFSFLFSLDSAKYETQIKNHYQPLQALYYENNGYLQSFHTNCYTGGFPNLKWNREEIFDTFLPEPRAPVDSIVSLQKLLNYLIPLQETQDFSIDSFDYIVVIHWNRFMGRQSKRLIQLVQENVKLSGNKTVEILYVNNDNIFTLED
jgi:hypothetical protein